MSIEESQNEDGLKDALKNRIAEQNLPDSEMETLFRLIENVCYDPIEDGKIIAKHKGLFKEQHSWVSFLESIQRLIEKEPKRKLEAQRYFRVKE